MDTNNGPSRSVRMRSAVQLRETGQRREVAVEEGQPVVVVLEVEAPPHALGQLVDETERGVVVAGPDPVEDGRRDLDPERLAGTPLSTRTTRGSAVAAWRTRTLRSLASLEPLKIDDVAWLLPVNAEALVADGQTGAGRRRRRGDRSHRGS